MQSINKVTLSQAHRLELKRQVAAAENRYWGADGRRADKYAEASSYLSAMDPASVYLQAVQEVCHGNNSANVFSKPMEVEMDRLGLRPTEEEQKDTAFKGLMDLDATWRPWNMDADKEEFQKTFDWNDNLTQEMYTWRWDHDPKLAKEREAYDVGSETDSNVSERDTISMAEENERGAKYLTVPDRYAGARSPVLLSRSPAGSIISEGGSDVPAITLNEPPSSMERQFSYFADFESTLDQKTPQ